MTYLLEHVLFTSYYTGRKIELATPFWKAPPTTKINKLNSTTNTLELETTTTTKYQYNSADILA